MTASPEGVKVYKFALNGYYGGATDLVTKSAYDLLAAERDALSKRVAELEAHLSYDTDSGYYVQMQALAAENARLRAALQAVIDAGDTDDSAKKMYWAARAALEKTVT